MFMHTAHPMHIIFSLLILYMFGPRIERDKGSAWFIRFYLLCGIAANVFSLLLRCLLSITIMPEAFSATSAGGFGATLGVLGAFCLAYHMMFFWIFWAMPVRVLYIFYAALAVQLAWLLAAGITLEDYSANLGALIMAWAILKTPWFRVSTTGGPKKPGKPKPPKALKGRRPPRDDDTRRDFLEV